MGRSRAADRGRSEGGRTTRDDAPVAVAVAVAGRPASGTILDLEVTDMALDGDPLGRLGDYVVFAPGAIPGERVRVKISSATRKLARAEVLQVLRPSPHRVTPRCKHFGPCGGCAWQHVAYPEQLRLKTRMLASLFGTVLGASAPGVRETIGLEGSGDARDRAAPWAFRNKAHFVFGPGRAGKSLAMGHYQRSSRHLVEVDECPVHTEEGNRLAFRARDALARYGIAGVDEETLRGLARHVVVRTGERSGQTQATVVVTRDDSRKLAAALRELTSGGGAPGGLHLNVHDRPGPFLFGRETRKIHGTERLLDEVAGASFLLSPTSFFQTSARSAEKLVGVVLGFVPEADRRQIIDLYAGAGLFSIPLALRGHRVTAVEENPAAVSDGLASLRDNEAHPVSCRFIRARVEDWLREFDGGGVREEPRFGTVILDPPREGCPGEVLTRILRRLRPDRVVYVSCNPRALASDLSLAAGAGYRVEAVQPVDMFPHTAHIEAVALLRRAAPHARE